MLGIKFCVFNGKVIVYGYLCDCKQNYNFAFGFKTIRKVDREQNYIMASSCILLYVYAVNCLF